MSKGAQSNLIMAQLFSAANLVSLGRAVLAPLILILLTAERQDALYAAFVLTCLAGASDVVDGYLARRHGSSSDYGRYIDGACDAIFNLAVFISFLAIGWISIVLFMLIYFAEIAVPYLGAFSKQIGHPFDVRWSARLKTSVHPIAQIAVIGNALYGIEVTPDAMVANFALGAAAAASVAYLVDHAAFAVRAIGRSAKAA